MQLEIDIAEYILNNPEYFVEDIPEIVNSLTIISNEIPEFNEEYQFQKTEIILNLIRDCISESFSLNSEDLNTIINKDLITKLLGEDYFSIK